VNETKLWPWEVSIDTTRIGLERLARALISTESQLINSYIFGDYPLGRGISAQLLIKIPKGNEETFKELCKPEDMRPPSRLQVGIDTYNPCPGHPGRQ